MKVRYWVLLLFFSLTLAQGQQLSLEDKIYKAVDAFVANPSNAALQKLEVSEKDFHPKSKSEWLALVILQCNKAHFQNQFGYTKEAISSYEKAWRGFQKNKLSNYDMVESCLQPLGNLYAIIGDYENAENTIKQYLYMATSANNPNQKYAAILNLSNVYQNTGRLAEAIDLLEETIQNGKLTKVQKGMLLTNLGNNYFLMTESVFPFKGNPYLKGEEAYKRAISLLQSEKNQAEPLWNAYRNLAKRYSVTSNNDTTNRYLQKANEQFILLPNLEPRKKAQFFYDEAYLFFKQGNYVAAANKNAQIFKLLIPGFAAQKSVLPKQNSLYAETVLLDALDLQAELFRAQKKPKIALQCYQLSFHIESLFEPMLVYENSKIITQVRNRNRTEKCLDIYYSLYQKEKKASYVEAAFLFAEKTKSTVLKQSVSASKSRSREEKLMVEQLQNWNTIIIKEQQKLKNADVVKINEAIKKQNELMLLLKSETPKKGTETKELALADLYAKLKKDNALMVEYFQGWERMFVFTIGSNTIAMSHFNITDTAIPQLVQFVDFFSNSTTISNDPLAYNRVANAKYKMLQLPKSTEQNLIIVPDGVLCFLPFEALITLQSTTTNFAKMHYLLNDYKIGYSNSADFYCNAIPFQHPKESVLGVFPIFKKSDLELAFSEKELQNIKANFNGNYLESRNATFENFKLNAGTFSILHLSTHANSGDLLDPASIRFYDKEVLYSELYNLDIQPDLVVLSACETGIGKLFKAEGAMSVARGFQLAGAQNLLFSLWKVNDYTTSVFMEKFYKHIKKGDSYFEANYQAKLEFLGDESISNTKKSPYYWAPFVYYGTLEKKAQSHYWPWIFVFCGIIALLWKLRTTKKHGRTTGNAKKAPL